jgi:hypothetical protein
MRLLTRRGAGCAHMRLFSRPKAPETPSGSTGDAREWRPGSRRVTDENRPVQVAGDSGWKHRPAGGGRGPDARGLILSALFFLPRGGSAQVTRALARARPAAGWQLRLAAGSLGQSGEPTQAASFFAGIDLHRSTTRPRSSLRSQWLRPFPSSPPMRIARMRPIASCTRSCLPPLPGSRLRRGGALDRAEGSRRSG